MTRRLAILALQGWAFIFVFFLGSEIASYEPGVRIATLIAYGGPLAAWAVFRLRGPRDRLDVAVLAALCGYAVVAWLARDRTGGMETLGLVVAWSVLFFAMREAGRSTAIRGAIAIAGATAVTAGLALTAYLWIADMAAWVAAGGGVPRLEGSTLFGWETANAVPVFALLLCGTLAWTPAGQVRSGLMSIGAVAAAITIPLSQGRAGWIGIGVAAGVFGFMWALKGGAFAPVRRLIIPASLVLVAVVGALGWRVLIAGLESSGRLALYEQGLSLAIANPLVGSGPSTYSWARLVHYPPAADLLTARLVHNVPLQTFADGGILLLVMFAAVTIAWGAAVWARRMSLGMSGIANVAVLIGFATICLLDDFSFLPAVTVTVITLAAWSVGPGVPANRGRGSLASPVIVGLLGLAALPFVVGATIGRSEASAGRDAAVAGNWVEAADHFEAALGAYPTNASYALGLGVASSAADDDPGADEAYRRAIALSPGDPRGYGGLAAVSHGGERVDLLQPAMERTLGDSQYAQRLADELIELGDIAGATDAWAQALVLDPWLIREVDARIARDEVLRAARALAQTSDLLISPRAREADLDLALAMGALPDDADPARLAVTAASNGDFTGAARLVEQARQSAPHQATTYLAAIAVAEMACMEPVARDVRLAELLVGNPGPLAEVRIVREAIYRDFGFGPSQPPGSALPVAGDAWPWTLLADRPDCRGSD